MHIYRYNNIYIQNNIMMKLDRQAKQGNCGFTNIVALHEHQSRNPGLALPISCQWMVFPELALQYGMAHQGHHFTLTWLLV